MSKEKEINQFELLERLITLGRNGTEIICAKVKLSQELNEINQTLLDKIDELKDISWRVNCKLRSVRQAVILEREYSDIVLAWTDKINQVVMTENQAKKVENELKIAGYITPVLKMTETNLLLMLDSFKTGKYNIILYTANRKVEIVDMPMLVEDIKQIAPAIEKIAQWTEPSQGRPQVPQPINHPERRRSPPRRHDPPPRDNSSKKLKQRFDFQFKSLIRILDAHAQPDMDSATTIKRSPCTRYWKT